MESGSRFPQEYELDHGFKLRLEYITRLGLLRRVLLEALALLTGDVLVERPSTILLETPDGETFVIKSGCVFARVSGDIRLRRIWTSIDELGLLPWLVEQRDKTWRLKKKQIARYDELIRRVEEAANGPTDSKQERSMVHRRDV